MITNKNYKGTSFNAYTALSSKEDIPNTSKAGRSYGYILTALQNISFGFIEIIQYNLSNLKAKVLYLGGYNIKKIVTEIYVNPEELSVSSKEILPKAKKNQADIAFLSVQGESTLLHKQQDQLVDYFFSTLVMYLKQSVINLNNLSDDFISTIKQPDLINFFSLISSSIKELLESIKNKNLNLNEVIDAIKIQVCLFNLNPEIKSMCYCLLNSIKMYNAEKEQLGMLLGLNDKDKSKYIDNIYKLFIEGDKLYISEYDYKNDIYDLGPFVFNNETQYINNCLRAFTYIIEKLILKNKPFKLSVLNDVMGIFASTLSQEYITGYSIVVSLEYVNKITQLLQQGKITKYILFKDINNISEKLLKDIKVTKKMLHGKYRAYLDKSLIEEYINLKLGGTTKIRLKESVDDPEYYVLDTITTIKNGAVHIELPDLALIKQPFLFVITDMNMKQLTLNVFFDERMVDKKEYAQKQINIFNEETTQTQNNLEYITSVVKLCVLLQRTHLYRDANGRSTFFIILPALLLKIGLLLTKQPRNLWNIIDILEYAEIAKQIESLCVQAPTIKYNSEINWLDALPKEEQLRYCFYP